MLPEFKEKFPEIILGDNQSDPVVLETDDKDWLFANELYPSYYGGIWSQSDIQTNNIILYLLAHLITTRRAVIDTRVSEIGGVTGILSSRSVGSISLSYGTMTDDLKDIAHYGEFMRTSYGRLYVSLRDNAYHSGGVFV